jgi:sugar-phosphatase
MKQLDCQAIIFDLDGVLIDSSVVIRRQWRRWATEHGLDPDRTLNVMHSHRLVEIVRHVAPHLDAEREAVRLAAWEAADADGLRVIKGAMGLVRSLPRGAWAVATSGHPPTALARLRYARLPVPDVLVTSDDVTRGKPHPEPYLRAAEGLGIPPVGCVVIEDAPAGVAAARAAEMRVIAVTTTHAADDLVEADVIAARLSDIQVVTGHPDPDQEGTCIHVTVL